MTEPTQLGRILLRPGEGRHGQGSGAGCGWGFQRQGRDRGHLRGENFRGQVSDVRRDLPPRQELCHFVAEGVTVVFKEVVGLTSVRCEKGAQL